ncbi:hypothetical protein LTR84_008155 [Exophiala bonariae]|uniref:Tyrosine specific protein phosphatases domain-containing protein n=1 Tax=Exophiala bonariae TaxID=1690606 RepID=A0AAV9NM38_9EURO|nr:hypothetical protein LTR84_008155 [Exophiala bonariae]
MATQGPTTDSSPPQSPPPTNPTEPYPPFLDVKPPADAPISSANGTLISPSEKEKELAAEGKSSTTPEPEEHIHLEFPARLPTPPFIHVHGVPNFRDLGGYRCSPPPSSSSSSSSSSNDDAGKIYTLRRGILFRCAHPTHLTPQGLETVTSQLKISRMYDLRSGPEIARLATTVANSPAAENLYPLADPNTGTIESSAAPGLERVFVPVYQSEDYGPVALARKLQWYTDEHRHDEASGFAYSTGFVNAYRDIATHGADAYRVIFRRLLDVAARGGDGADGATAAAVDGPGLIFHCTAGKDRTGVFGALIHRLVGVDDDTICWEYALTEPGLGRWRDQFIKRISAGGLGGGGGKPSALGTEKKKDAGEPAEKIYQGDRKTPLSRAEAARICGSRAGNMRAWLTQVLDGEFGGVEKYLKEKCGLSGEEVKRLREFLTVEVNGEDEVIAKSAIEGWTPEGGVVD